MTNFPTERLHPKGGGRGGDIEMQVQYSFSVPLSQEFVLETNYSSVSRHHNDVLQAQLKLAVSKSFQQRGQHFYYVGTSFASAVVSLQQLWLTKHPDLLRLCRPDQLFVTTEYRAQCIISSDGIVTRHFSRVCYINGLTLHKPVHRTHRSGKAALCKTCGGYATITRAASGGDILQTR